jgi:regulator of replication initiation timing
MSIIDHAREIAELVKKYNDQDLYQKIVDLREEILGLREENLTLRDENRRLKESQALSAKLVRHGNCYYREEDTEHTKPFCLACWDADRKLVSLILGQGYGGVTTIRCNVCDARKKET